jgi:hypothetical protein
MITKSDYYLPEWVGSAFEKKKKKDDFYAPRGM